MMANTTADDWLFSDEDYPTTASTNVSDMDVLEGFIRTMIEGWRYQARVDTTWYSILVLLYATMILFGATGNLLVILVVVRNSAMRTARNVFIVNLAVSDLMLCLITMPLTLVEILYMTWQVRASNISKFFPTFRSCKNFPDRFWVFLFMKFLVGILFLKIAVRNLSTCKALKL